MTDLSHREGVFGRRISRRRMLVGAGAGIAGLAGAALIGCGDDDDDEAAPAAQATQAATATQAAAAATAAATAAPAGGDLIVQSNSSPHISVIDIETKQVTRTADIPDFTSWTWNDDNNYFDGKLLWLGTKNRDTNEVTVITLDLDSLEVTHRIPIGPDPNNVYIGKALADRSIVHVGKQGSGQVVAINPRTFAVMATWDVPTGSGDEGVVCDADISTDAIGVERFVYPTRAGDSLVSIDPTSGETLKEVATPTGATPLMLSTSADGRIWIQESGSNTNSVYEPVNLDLIKRFPSAKGPVISTYSPDGQLAYIGHFGDPVVQVIATERLEEVTRITVGSTPSKIAVHQAGTFIYPIVSKEASVAVVDTSSWEVTERIDIGTNPGGIFLRPRA